MDHNIKEDMFEIFHLRDILPGVELKADLVSFFQISFKYTIAKKTQYRTCYNHNLFKVHIPPDDTFNAERKTCYLLGRWLWVNNVGWWPLTKLFAEKGVVAIFGPLSKSSSEHIRSITDRSTSFDHPKSWWNCYRLLYDIFPLITISFPSSMEIPYIETRWNYRGQNMIGKIETGVE